MGKDILKNNMSRIGKIARRSLASQKIPNPFSSWDEIGQINFSDKKEKSNFK